MVDKIHEVFYEKYDGVIINPGAWTHYSYAIHDALEILECPILEVHMSNIFNREDFRSHSVIAPVAHGMIAGNGCICIFISSEGNGKRSSRGRR